MKKELPKEVSRGKVKIGGLEVEVIVLDTGQRVIAEESFKKFLGMVGEVKKELESFERQIDSRTSQLGNFEEWSGKGHNEK